MYRRPILTLISSVAIILGNFLAWAFLIWGLLTRLGWPVNELPYISGVFVLIYINLPSLFLLLLASWRNEPKLRFRRFLYIFLLMSSLILYLIVRGFWA